MLQINLLPINELRKAYQARQQFSGLIALFVMVVALLFAVGYYRNAKIEQLKVKISAVTAEKNSYEKIARKIDQIEKATKELERKDNIIAKLKTDSSLTVRLMDEVANRVDNQRMWLTSLQQQGNSMNLKGVALDNPTVAQFMDNLKASPYVIDVSLTNSSLKIVSGLELKSFDLNCEVSQPQKIAESASSNAKE